MLTTQWAVNWGDGSSPQIVNDPNPVLYPNAPLVPWVIHQYATAGDYSIVVTAQTPDGIYSAPSTSTIVDVAMFGVGIGGGSGGSLQVTLPDQPPTLHVAGLQNASVGAEFALDNLVSISDSDQAAVAGTLADGNSFTNDYTYTIDWGDGSTPFAGTNVEILADGGSGSPFLGALTSNTADGLLTHAYSDPGTYNIAVTVTDSSGLSDTQTIPITVYQLAPTITGMPGGNTCNEGIQSALVQR
jgi:PKD repeat protein